MLFALIRSELDPSIGPALATSEPFEVLSEVGLYRPMISAFTRRCELTFQSPY